MANAIPPVPSNEITPEGLYLNRRTFMRASIVTASVAVTGLVYRKVNAPPPVATETKALTGLSSAASAPVNSGFTVNEPLTSLVDITNYNNYYEFTTDKTEVARVASGFNTAGWKIEVGGMVRKPQVFDLDDLQKLSPPQERIYRMRCVEAWSMVIPWAGFPLSDLINRVEPLSGAKYVAFESLADPKRMPGLRTAGIPFPYLEGLRMDEAMHPLTILARGIYGKELPPQDGAPLRLVVPWKYGFKGIKSIVRINLTAEQPPSTWNLISSREYGFYANVNPNHDHPRWSQATEQRIGAERVKTLMFNGYADQVASLYAGMDLDRFY